MIRLEGVCLNRGMFSLKGIDLTISRGEHLFIIGPSGSGKTLLLETIAGIHGDASGRIVIMGRDVAGLLPEERGVSLMYQDCSLFPHLTVAENIGFGLMVRGIPESETATVVENLAERFGIAPLRDRYPASLSGGEKQRVALARALATSPALLLLDEPFAAIDSMLKSRFIDELSCLKMERDLTIIQVSHSREEVYALADRVAVMIDGRLQQVGTCDEVFCCPVSREIAVFTGYENILEGTVTSGDKGPYLLVAAGIRIGVPQSIPPGTRMIACIRSTDVVLQPGNFHGSSMFWRTDGLVTNIRKDDSGVSVTVDCGVPIISWFSHREMEQYQWHLGQEVGVFLPSRSVHLFYPDHLAEQPTSQSGYT